MKNFLFIILSFTIIGCTTIGQPYSPPPQAPEGKSLIFFMRTSVGYGNFWSTVFSVDGTEVVSLYDKGYSWIHLPSGNHNFSAGTILNSDYLNFDMNIETGREYYIEFTQESAGYSQYRNVIRAVNPSQGKSLVEKYSYKEAEKINKSPN